jgi:hypothetical protein
MVRKVGNEECMQNFGGEIPRETSTRMTAEEMVG